MLRRRVIPCLDVADGRVVKGVRFVDLVDEGDPPELAERYAREGADELVFLDITAAPERRGTLLDIVERTARRAFIPLTVGGGVRTVDEMRDVLRAGADKVSLNTAAVADPSSSTAVPAGSGARRRRRHRRAARRRRVPRYSAGRSSSRAAGRRPGSTPSTGPSGPSRSAPGELLVTSMDRDGTGSGLRHRAAAGDRRAGRGAGHRLGRGGRTRTTSSGAVVDGGADAVLAASIFHRRIHSIAAVKAAMAAAGLPVRDVAEGSRVTTIEPRYGAGRPGHGRRPGRRRRAGADGRPHGRRGPRRRRWRPARSTSTRARAIGCGARARRPGTSCGSSTWRSTATAMPLLVTVEPVGPTCHRGVRSCFDAGRTAPAERTTQGFAWLETLWSTIAARAAERPAGSYTSALLDGGVDAVGRKVTEEATEVLLAAKDDAVASSDGDARRARRRDRRPAVPRARPARRAGPGPGRGHRHAARPPRAAEAARLTAGRPRRVGPAEPVAARSRAGACRSGPRATPRRSAPGRLSGSVDLCPR